MKPVFDLSDYISLSGQSVAYLVFFLVAIIAAVVSVILFFHWRKYGVGSGRAFALVEVAYLLGVVVFLGTAFLSLN